ncbi:hypothetical protein [Streptomyces sp. HUAS TT3]|uniref:hypothetical protein n=1 Tax=Streptomyces sp. HUAS TT3 TaxID=3447510 RepID=UPI003F654F60
MTLTSSAFHVRPPYTTSLPFTRASDELDDGIESQGGARVGVRRPWPWSFML